MGERSQDILAYLPASLVWHAAEHAPAELPWRLEVDGTMVMADLSGFTALSERLARLGDEGAERLTDIINSFFERMLKTASRYGGDTLTFGGDAILLLFEGPEHAMRAAVAALEMLRQVERAAAVEAASGKVKIGMSVGAHSDRFVLAGVGLDDERAHLVVLGQGGEMTALAEAQAERGQLAVSTDCKKLLPAGSRFEPAGDFWLVDELGACALPRPGAESPELTDGQLRRLDPFLPPYARATGCSEDTEQEAQEGIRLTPEHRRTVVVFVDLLGLDVIIDGRGLDAAVEELQAYAAMLTRLAAKHSGFVVSSDIARKGSKFIVTFGAPVAHEYAPANAARFALDLNAGLRESGLDLHHKIGVNGGHVFAGEVGPAFRRQYTVMGDAVNLAARLMAAAELDTALISRNLLSYVSHTLCARELPSITVKGKEKPVAICVLEEEGVTEGQIRGELGRARLQGRLFGRRKELDLLTRAWESTRRGEGTTLLVEGEAGVGKTRLLDEALRSISATGQVVRAACLEHLQAAPFVPWVDVLHAVMQLSPDESADDRTVRVQEFLEQHLADWVELGPLLNPLLGVTLLQNRVVGSLEPQSRRRRLMELITSILLADVSGTGRVVVVEDMHWADESSLALLEHAVTRVTASPVLLLLTTRPTTVPTALREGAVTRLTLAELTRSQSLAMVREALDVIDLPPEVGDAIYSKTKGNPLFLEEVINSLQQPGVLDRILGASTVTRAGELAALEIPDRVQGLLMSCIDRLTADTREVLRAGAVAGRSFDTQLLRSIDDSRLRNAPLDRALDELEAAALVVREDGAGSTATFRHALVQDVAYDSLPFARRRELHGEIAHFLESSQSPPDHALLVHHYHRAGDREKSRLYAVRASEDSAAAYANREAVDYLAIASAAVRGRRPDDACLRSRFDELEGDSLQTFGSHEEAIRAFLAARRRWSSPAVRNASAQALADLSPVDDVDARDSLLCWKASLSMQRGPSAFRRAIHWLDLGMRALPPDRRELAARILVAKTVCLCRLARNREALDLVDEGLAIAREVDDVGLVAYACSIRSLALSQLGRLGEAIESSRAAIAGYEQAGDLVGEAQAHANLAMAAQSRDDPAEGLAHFERALAIYVRLGDRNGIVFQHHNVGACLLQMGDVGGATRHLEQTIAAYGTEGCPPFPVGWAYVLLAIASLMQEDPEAADIALQKGWDILSDIGADYLLLNAQLVAAQVDLACGRDVESLRKCEEVLAASRAADAVPIEAEALHSRGLVWMAEGRPEAAVADFESYLTLADETDSKYDRALALAALAEAQAACAERDPSCEDHLGEAIRLFRKMGIRYELQKALDLQSRLRRAATTAESGDVRLY